MQEQDKEFKIGQKVRYIGGDPDAFVEVGQEGIVHSTDSYWEDCVVFEFNGFNFQDVKKSCLEIVE